MKKLKIWIGNYDGSHTAIVSAHSKKQAVELLGADVSMGYFNGYYSEQGETGNAEALELGNRYPGEVLLRKGRDGNWFRRNGLPMNPGRGGRPGVTDANLSEIARDTGVSFRSIIRWRDTRPKLFRVIVAGHKALKVLEG